MNYVSVKSALLIYVSTGVIPFLFSNSTIDSDLLPRFLALSILTFVLILTISALTLKGSLGGSKLKHDDSLNVIFYLLLGFLLIAGLALFKAINFSEGLFEWCKLFLAFAYFYAAVFIIGERFQSIFHLVRALTITGFILGIIGLCQYFRVGFLFIPGNFEMHATLAHKNLFASALLLLFPFAFYGVIRMGGVWRVISLGSASLNVFCIGAARTRSVWLAMVVATLATLTVYFKIRRKATPKKMEISKRSKTYYLPYIFIAALLLIVALSSKHPFKFARPVSSVESMTERLLIWNKTFRMINDNPFIGVGPGQWKIIFPKYGKIDRWLNDSPPLEPAEVIHQRPHNDYLWIMAEFGYIGFILYISFFILLLYYIYEILKHSSDKDIRTITLLLLFVITGYMVVALFSFPKERMVHTMLLMLTAACIVSTHKHAFPLSKDSPFFYKLTTNIIILFFLALCIIICIKRYHSEVWTQKALSARRMGQWNRVIAFMDQVDMRFYNMDPVSMPLLWYRGVANYSLNRVGAAFIDFQKAFKIHPYNIHVLNNLGVCHAVKGDYVKAIEFYQKALAIHPHFKEARKNMRQVHIILNNKEADKEGDGL